MFFANLKRSKNLRESGIKIIGDIPWGTHFCQFYKTNQDLLEILVPYFAAGLKNNEFCMWVTSGPQQTNDAILTLREMVPNLKKYIALGQIEILDYSQWYLQRGKFRPEKVLDGWIKKNDRALQNGFNGVRSAGNTFWLEKKQWKDFAGYEAGINDIINKYNMIAICTYSTDKCGIDEIMDIIANHQFAIIKREGKWNLIENSEQKKLEKKLIETEEEKYNLSKYASIYIFEMDFRIPGFLSVNDAMCGLLGYSREELLSMSPFDMLDNKGKILFRERIQKWLSGENPNEKVEYKVISRDGREIYVLLNVTIKSDENGKPFGATVIGQDITELKKAEEALRKSEEEYKTLFESIYQGFCIIEVLFERHQKPVDYRFLMVNPAFESQTGIKNAVGKRMKEIAPLHEEHWFETYGKIVLTGKPIHFENQAEELHRYYDVYAWRIGEPVERKVAILFNDITASRKLVDALREGESQLKSAQRIAKLGSWELDLKENKLKWSDEVYRIFGIDRTKLEASYKVLMNTIHPDDRKKVDDAYNKSLKTKIPYNIVYRLKFPDGSIKYVREICETYFTKENKPIKSFGTVQDITDQINTELELKRLASFAELNPNPIIEITLKGKVVYANPVTLKHFSDIVQLALKHPMLIGLNLNQIKNRRRQFIREILIRGRWYHQNINYISETDSIRIYSIDITERKELEQQKDEFLNIASHELKTPLTSIKAFSQILKKRLYKDKESNYFAEQIDNHTDKLTILVSDLMDVGKISAGRLQIKMDPLNINALVDKIIEDFRITTDSHEFIKHGGTSKKVMADEDRLTQVLVNLLSNAIKYSPNADKVMINITEKEKKVIVSVQDFGIGIAESFIPRVFERYFRAKDDKKGFGLGLFISREIIKQHKGKMWAESQENKGSTFYFSLPIC